MSRRFFVLIPLVLTVLAVGRTGTAFATRCDFALHEGRRLVFENRLTAELRSLRRTDWVINQDRVRAVRALFRSNHGFELDADTVRLRELISSDVLERRVSPRQGLNANLTHDLARALKLHGRVLAARDEAYLVALPPPAGDYVGYQFMPFDLFFVMPIKAQSAAGSRAQVARRRVSEGVFGVRLGADVYGEDDDVEPDWYLIDDQSAAIYVERLLRLTTDDLIVHPSYRRAVQAF